jgi:ferredoxin
MGFRAVKLCRSRSPLAYKTQEFAMATVKKAPPTPSAGGAGITVTVDHDVCSGTGHCKASMPHVFVVVDRKSYVRSDVDWESVDVEELNVAADDCPWFAISITTTAKGS